MIWMLDKAGCNIEIRKMKLDQLVAFEDCIQIWLDGEMR